MIFIAAIARALLAYYSIVLTFNNNTRPRTALHTDNSTQTPNRNRGADNTVYEVYKNYMTYYYEAPLYRPIFPLKTHKLLAHIYTVELGAALRI